MIKSNKEKFIAFWARLLEILLFWLLLLLYFHSSSLYMPEKRRCTYALCSVHRTFCVVCVYAVRYTWICVQIYSYSFSVRLLGKCNIVTKTGFNRCCVYVYAFCTMWISPRHAANPFTCRCFVLKWNAINYLVIVCSVSFIVVACCCFFRLFACSHSLRCQKLYVLSAQSFFFDTGFLPSSMKLATPMCSFDWYKWMYISR